MVHGGTGHGRRSWGAQLHVCALALMLLACASTAQEPLDLFADSPELGAGFIRIGAWNLRHINLEGQARDLLPGTNDDEDFAILVATFAKGIQCAPRRNGVRRRVGNPC